MINPGLLSQCVHCGFCLQACPTYILWGNEMDSPRGRIYLMDMLNQAQTAMTPKFVQHMDSCLGCVSCMTACPSGVNYGKLIEETRSQIEQQYKRPLRQRVQRWAILHTFPNVALLRIGRAFFSAYQKLGLPSLNALVPKLGKREDVSGITPAQGSRASVGLLLGCVQREFLPEINAATVRVLAAEGCEVVAPAEQPCCGALLMHAGKDQAALALTRRLFATFEKAGVDTIITNAGGCGSHLKEFSADFKGQVKDVAEFLMELGPRAERHPVAKCVAYHDSCHLQHAQKIRTQPRELLAQIPGLTLAEMPESALCCGSAGIYNLVQPVTANQLGDRKASHIQAIAPDAVATGNVGCILQMQAALARHPANPAPPVLHTIQLLDESIRGAC
ncbi:MAG: heterodisulfide reductase-related iron-sulfur binding cluster [Acidobacteriota bacterium]|nr:heterodisulfide reductase-related iron-sulfur binding cluster [Acidobacteriota bacterium]